MEDNFWNEKTVRDFSEFYFDDRRNHYLVHGSGVHPTPFKILLNKFKEMNRASTKATDDVRERIQSFRHSENKNHIISFSNKYSDYGRDSHNTLYPRQYFLERLTEYEIYSALSKDNVEFKIGDVLSGSEIKGFEIADNSLMVVFQFNKMNIDYLEKAEEKKPLFTVQDCNVYEGDRVYAVSKVTFIPYNFVATQKSDFAANDNYFLTEIEQKQFISYRQKTISFSDIENFCDDSWFEIHIIHKKAKEHILEHFRPKEK